MCKIKICGIKRLEDVEYVNKFLPEYIGFIFAESKRQVSSELAKQLSIAAHASIKKVGVFVNETMENIVSIAHQCGLDIVQLHGDESADYLKELKDTFIKTPANTDTELVKENIQIWKAFRVKDSSSLEGMAEYAADAYLLDAYVHGSFGGAGMAFDWDVAVEAGKHNKIILAGGLNPANVQKAVRMVKPYAVDVSSGVETNGIKDKVKIGEFVCKARSYE